MLRLAQCEKAVTISELMGYSRPSVEVSGGSKTPGGWGIRASGSLACVSSSSRLSTRFYLVLNDLQAEKASFLEELWRANATLYKRGTSFHSGRAVWP